MRLIDADAFLVDAIKGKRFVFYSKDMLSEMVVVNTVYDELANALKHAPAVDAEPVRHGFWKNRGNHLQCNLCGHKYTRYDCEGNVVGYYWCPNCGTKMHTEARDE